MAKFISGTVFSFLIISTLSICASADERKVYIVYMGELPKNEYSPLAHHQSMLQEVLQNSVPSDALIHSYKRSFNGFAANLTKEESQKLSSMEGILSVLPSRNVKLHTTRSWDFLGFKEKVKRVPVVESNVIVGVIDSGIYPDAESFSDQGFSPPPKKWKGACRGGKNFTCNNKLIGARFYSSTKAKDRDSARDTIGHGTHTASTVAGNLVKNVSFDGVAQGSARGAVPLARIAVYKVCWSNDCAESDILAAFDDAIDDGVDVLSVSLGFDEAVDYSSDPLAIGSFHAMRKNILTVQSAGNSGPKQESVVAVAPWILSVAASSTDRQIIDKVTLGDNTTLVGRAINSFDMEGKKFPLMYDPLFQVIGSKNNASIGAENLLNKNRYEGKIIFHDSFSPGQIELDSEAVGMVLGSDQYNDYGWNYPLPASLLSSKDGETVRSYIEKTKLPVATIKKSETIQNTSAPVIASFSSRGPNIITKSIFKANITAPGVDILAALPPGVPPSSLTVDHRSVKYGILSGTSMSCPHASGAAAYVKTFHPKWSPAAIKSALMTTAFPMSSKKNPEAEFAYGAGNINPVVAVHPGLVYDALEGDYVKMLCSIGYTTNQIKILSGHINTCSKHSRGSPSDLNYPAMVSTTKRTNFTRTVTNVGVANSTYRAIITSPPDVNISVKPNVLSFKSLYEKKSFVVKVSTRAVNRILSGSLVWSDGAHNVRSPIVVYVESNVSTKERS
ncbi:hypothetical protein ACHQM5_020084 [Ranunculus cassubicifolius]